MKKGVIGAIIIFFVIALAVATISYALGTMLSRQGIAKRGLFEASLISESDKVETYARSLLRATDLSSFQAVYDSGTENIVLPYDFNPSGFPKYSSNYKMAYWQIYDEEDNRMPPPPIMLNKTKQEVTWISSCYLYDYIKAYINFVQTSDFSITLPDPTLSPIITRVIYIDDKIVSTEGDEILFQRTTEVGNQEIDIARGFNPYSNVTTNFGRIIEITWGDIIKPDLLGGCVAVTTKEDDAQNCLNSAADNLKNTYPDINFIFKILPNEFRNTTSEARAIINVSIYDNSKNYTFFSFPYDRVKIDFLGVNFLAKVGNLIENFDPDIVQASSLSNFYDCGVASGYSGFGVISPKPNKDDICKFFKVSPTEACQDTDGGLDFITAGTCTDFTGSYGDMCFDLDNDNVDETLYEYGCHSSGVCYYEKIDCLATCSDGACQPSASTSTTTTTVPSDCGPLSESDCISRSDCSPCCSGTAYKDCCNPDEECVKIVGDAWCEVAS